MFTTLCVDSVLCLQRCVVTALCVPGGVCSPHCDYSIVAEEGGEELVPFVDDATSDGLLMPIDNDHHPLIFCDLLICYIYLSFKCSLNIDECSSNDVECSTNDEECSPNHDERSLNDDECPPNDDKCPRKITNVP